MHRVTKELHFCYGHRLLNYNGKCRFLHGHNGIAVITLESDHLDSLGMVMDFTKIKTVMQSWIDQELDHKMILHQDDPLLPTLRSLNEPFYLLEVNPTAEHLAKLIFDYAQKQHFPVSEVSLWESPNSYATYRPTPI